MINSWQKKTKSDIHLIAKYIMIDNGEAYRDCHCMETKETAWLYLKASGTYMQVCTGGNLGHRAEPNLP